MFIIHRLTVLSMLLLLISRTTGLPAMMREDMEKMAATTTANLVFLTTDTTIEEVKETTHTTSLVQVDRFAQLVAAHWLFDHLESVKSRSYDHIATRLGSHVELLAVGSHGDNDDNTLVDLDILKAQIFGAIQAHIGGHLPVVWDDLSADTLSKPALERHIATLVNTRCPTTRPTEEEEEEEDNTAAITTTIAPAPAAPIAAPAAAAVAVAANSVEHACLLQRGDQILAELDRYVMRHLQNIFRVMDTQVMPDLLKHTEKDLRQVIDYFNGVQQQQASMQLALQILPWHAPYPAADADATNAAGAPTTVSSSDQGSSSSNPDPQPSSFLSSYTPDDHDSHRIDQYANLAIVL